MGHLVLIYQLASFLEEP